MLTLEVVSGFYGAEAINGEPWLTRADYPREAISKLEEGGFRVALSIDPLGTPHYCTILLAPEPKSFKSFKAKICALLLRRARFIPARDKQGHALDAIYTTSISFSLDRTLFKSYDLEIPVNRLPGGASMSDVTIYQLVEASGLIAGCHASKSSGSLRLDELACRSAVKMPVAQVTDQNGRPIRAVVRQVILFRVH